MDNLQRIKNLRSGLKDLRDLGAIFRQDLYEIGNVIDQDKFPSTEGLESWGENLLAWMKKSGYCLELYEQIFGDNFLENFSDVERALDSEEKKIREANIFGQAEKFLHFITKTPDLRRILREHQTKLKRLLARKRRNTQLKTALEPYANFINATEETDIGKKFSAGKELSEIFGDDFIGRGLFGHELILTLVDGDKPALPVEEPKKILPPQQLPPTPQPSVVDNYFENILRAKGAFLKPSDIAPWEKIFSVEKSDRNREFSASRFKRDFKNPEILRPVLGYAALRGFLAFPTFCPKRMPPEILASIIQLLINKGYIQKYAFENRHHFYGLTKNFFDFVKTDNGRRFLNSKRGEKVELENLHFLEYEAKYALTRAVYMHVHIMEFDRGNNFIDVEFSPQMFRSEFSGVTGRDLLLGCFWDKPNDCNKFIRKFRIWLQRKGEGLRRIIVAGVNVKHAEKIFDAVEEATAEDFPDQAGEYIYSFETDAIYRRGTRKKLSPKEIWPSDEPDDDDDPEPENNSDDEPENQSSDAAPTMDATAKENHLRDVKAMIHDEKFYCATAYLKAQISENETVEPLYRRLAFALDDPLLNTDYNSDEVRTLLTKNADTFDEALIIAATLRSFFYNRVEYDYGISTLYDRIKSFKLLAENEPLANLIRETKNFKETNQKGADYFIAFRSSENDVSEEFAHVVQDAKEYYRLFFKGDFRGETNYTVARTKQLIFAAEGEFGKTFALIKDETENIPAETVDAVKKFLAENFIRKGAALEKSNIDKLALQEMIDDCWDVVKSRTNKNGIVGSRRSNLMSNLERAAEIMCAWVRCAENLSGDKINYYGKTFADMLKDVNEARSKIAGKLNGNTLDAAGFAVLNRTLDEIYSRLYGAYNDDERKYFYAEFLRGEEIVLDEDFLPKFDLNITDGTSENITAQILKHAALKLPTFEERIEKIFKESGDDFGTAQLIDEYLKFKSGKSILAEKGYNLQKCIVTADLDAQNALEDFMGFVELVQIHGQLDDINDGEKEKIFQVIDNCYDYAKSSGNFGVFFRVKKFWEDKIAENAAKLEKIFAEDLQQALSDYKRNVGDFEPGELKESVAEIEKLIAAGHFTASKMLINELRKGNLYKKSDRDESLTLRRFIADYDDCYGQVQDSSKTLEFLLEKKTIVREKFSKNGAKLIENWLPNGIPDTDSGKEKIRERVKNLLELLAFDVETADLEDSDDSTAINIVVKLKKSFQVKHTHPIAAFGSEAEVDKFGFRVTCLFGKFPEKNLIDHFKKSDKGNTLVLLDHALKLPERQRLAKAIKLDKTLMHVFAVVDRVVMMYLIKNCSEQIKTKRINDTLMSIVMPFSRCQPYIWDPHTPLPPEMFIGRKNAMSEVKSPNGVNIVYGGRQLGKSALLKMACREIDGNNNQRAIFVDLRFKGYKEAALFVSGELSDKKFFDTPIETDDWEELAREIRNRLLSEEPNKISYFLLMLDEADKFIADCAEVDYRPISELAKIQQENYGGSRFKFVIAGLHNIVRFEKEQIQSGNKVLPTLKSLTIKPFVFEEARELLEVPLRCLGLEFSDDKWIFTIAETALYFPSLLQLFCEKLLLTLFEPSYAGYGANTPPYEITEKHIKKVLADEEFRNDIKDRIDITLRLGDDKYYYVVAQILAYLYRKSRKDDGYSAQDILNCLKDLAQVIYLPDEELKIEKILPNDETKIVALMLELCELNILKRTDTDNFLFSRRRIFHYMGTEKEIEDALFKLMAEAANG